MQQQPVLQISYSLSDIKNVSDKLWQYAHQYQVWALHGDMGVGKTTLISALCDMLGVDDAVSSPTFSIINEYSFLQNDKEYSIYHMDWYRLEDEQEAVNAGVEDAILQPDAYSIIEWPEKASGLLPENYLKIEIELEEDGQRTLRAFVC